MDKKTKNTLIASFFGICLVVILMMQGVSINDAKEKIKQSTAEIQTLKTQVETITKEKAAIQAELIKLKTTDSYFYQKSVDQTQAKDYKGSLETLKELRKRYPQSKMMANVAALESQNKEAIASDLYAEAYRLQAQGNFDLSSSKVSDITTNYPESSVVDKARALIPANEAGQKEASEKAERAGSDLELIDWGWSREYEYITAEGQVKNITDHNLDNVMAVMEALDGDKNMITSHESFISYNPILPGQTSPFKVMLKDNPAIKKGHISFKTFAGGEIPTYRKPK